MYSSSYFRPMINHFQNEHMIISTNLYTFFAYRILMIFGIIWQLLLKQIVNDTKLLPRFNSRIFFYLFLPSTVLDSASMLANKWLFFNLISILILSIVGTLIYSASIGFTILALSHDSIFTVNFVENTSLASSSSDIASDNSSTTSDDSNIALNPTQLQLSPMANLTLIDCLILGTILSSFDSNTMLNSLRLHQANEKLYYLVLGENLMNNAVVLVIFNVLLEFLNEPRLTLFIVYGAILKFFLTLLGAVVIGFCLAFIALLSIRCIKHFRSNRTLTNYQNQCLAMVETLLILKLGYFSYTLAALAGTSSILCLATFGVLQNEYIKRNLTLRSQFTLRQITYATKTLGYSLVYPLIGMLIVQVIQDININHHQHHLYSNNLPSILQQNQQQQLTFANNNNNPQGTLISTSDSTSSSSSSSTSSVATTPMGSTKRDSMIHKSINMFWILKLLSFLCLILLAYRFLIVIILSQINNILSSRQLRIHFVEQILLAYGSLKGPLALALVHRLIEHEQYRDRSLNEKHLFIYTILFITFISNVFKGPFIRPLVARVQLTLCHSLKTSNKCIVFNQISCVVMDYATHGLNSILGRKKSFYDRFVELNEHLFKPFVAGTGSSTNWLLVFYDNLILEETMNANCFHTSIRESARQLANKKNFKHQTESFGSSAAPDSILAADSLGIMEKLKRKFKSINTIEPTTNNKPNTNGDDRVSSQDMRNSSSIDRNAGPRHQQHIRSLNPINHGGEIQTIVNNQEEGRFLQRQYTNRMGHYKSRRLINKQPTESALLREIVLYNLNQEEMAKQKKGKHHHRNNHGLSYTKTSPKTSNMSQQILPIGLHRESSQRFFESPSSINDDGATSLDVESHQPSILRRNYERDMYIDALESAIDREFREKNHKDKQLQDHQQNKSQRINQPETSHITQDPSSTSNFQQPKNTGQHRYNRRRR